MTTQPENGPSKAEQRRIRIRRARIVTTVLAVVATVVLGVVLATSDPSRAASPTASRVRTAPAAPDTGSGDGYSPGDSGRDDGRQFSNGDNGGGSINNGGGFNSGNGGGFSGSGSGSDTQTHGS